MPGGAGTDELASKAAARKDGHLLLSGCVSTGIAIVLPDQDGDPDAVTGRTRLT